MMNAITQIDIGKTACAKEDICSGSSSVSISMGCFIFRGDISFRLDNYTSGILIVYVCAQILAKQVSCDPAYIITLIKSSVQFQDKY